MIEEIKKVKYTCDWCGAHVIEERVASEANELPDLWTFHVNGFKSEGGGLVDNRKDACELAWCQYQGSQWSQGIRT